MRVSTNALPVRVRSWLDHFNLTEAIDRDLDALGLTNDRPGLSPDAPEKRHPVVIVPGFTSCGLEVWKAHPCLGEGYFRKRVWGDVSMAQAILKNWTCWLHHLAPDPRTGSDRPGTRVRAATGLRSADYFVGNYWLWARLIQNLADVGYNEADILLACYDWRITFRLLEERDGYFTSLKHDIEKLVVRHRGEKTVVIGHSMGALVWYYFMSWVERQSPGWIDKHVGSFINIAGAFLGAMGPLAGFLSGEMESTAAMGPLASYMDTFAMSFDAIRGIYWSMGGLGALLPVGGDAVWGSEKTGFTDTPVDVLTFDDGVVGLEGRLDQIYASVEEKKDDVPLFHYPAWQSYYRGVARPLKDRSDPSRFGNPLASALPDAPNLKIFCLYGVGQPTERSYRYRFRQVRWRWGDTVFAPESGILRWSLSKSIQDTIRDMLEYNEQEVDASRPVIIDYSSSHMESTTNITTAVLFLRQLLDDPHSKIQDLARIDTGFHSDATEGPWNNGLDGVYTTGVSRTAGDSTVPLVSLAYMCHNGWRDFKELNPSGVKVYSREFQHLPSSLAADPRGGPAAAKHVEIIGNYALIADVLSIAAGKTELLEEDRIFSNITRIGPTISERIRSVFH